MILSRPKHMDHYRGGRISFWRRSGRTVSDCGVTCAAYVQLMILACLVYYLLHWVVLVMVAFHDSSDVFPIRSAIESELLAVQTHHKRQKAEATYKQKLTEIKKIYERMRCGTLDGARTDTENPSDSTGALILPPLSVFCTLPSVRALKGSPDPSAVPPTTSTSATIDIKSSPLATSLIESDLHTWLVPVQKYLMSLLGYPNGWQSASTRMLPPLQRVTARFFCRRCGEGRVGRAHQRERCLDLKGVCSHVCVATQGKSIEGRHQEAPQEGETEAPNTHDGNNKQEKGKNRDKKNSGAKTLDWKMDLFEKDEKVLRFFPFSQTDAHVLVRPRPFVSSNRSSSSGAFRRKILLPPLG